MKLNLEICYNFSKIYPFSCNMSQMEAIEKALTHQIRVIEGPPGTIEVDGYRYHKEGIKQHRRNQLKDNILKKYQIPLERFKTNGSNEKERLIRSLYEMSGKSSKENK